MSSGRPRRSDGTRAVILAAARERFAADGYERATIRAIAAAAGVDPAMVMRYYGSKDRLFATAAEFDLRLPDLGAVDAGRIGRTLARHILDRWEYDPTMTALLRAGMTNEAAAERMRDIFEVQFQPLVLKVSPDPAEVPVRSGLAAAQVLGFALCRYVLALPPIATMGTEEVVHWLGPTLQHYLTS